MSTKKSDAAQSTHLRIAITNISGELVFETNSSVADVKSAVAAAIAAKTTLALQDIRGHEIIVPADKIAFVEVGNPAARRVGFGAL